MMMGWGLGARGWGTLAYTPRSPSPQPPAPSPNELPIRVLLRLADLALRLTLEVLRLALELFARIAGQTADCVANFSFGFLAQAFDLVLEAVGVEIVRHCVLLVRVIVPGATKATAVPSQTFGWGF